MQKSTNTCSVKDNIANISQIDESDKINLCQKLSSFKRTGDDLVSGINSIIRSWDEIIIKKKKIINQLNKDIEKTKEEIITLRQEFNCECNKIKDDFNKEKENWETLVQKSKKFKIDEIIKLNVGGKKFITSKNMFENCYLDQNFLTAMFSGAWSPNKDAEDHYFIDRDGTYFGYILNYFRDRQYESVIKTLDIKTKKSLLVEANYYRITELIKVLQRFTHTNEELVNKRVRVYWEKEKKWFAGKIYKYCKYDQKHLIKYDDGDEKSYSLQDKNWELLD